MDSNICEMDQLIYCPLLTREIAKGYCYEINLVAAEMFNADTLDDDIGNPKTAFNKCKKCVNFSL